MILNRPEGKRPGGVWVVVPKGRGGYQAGLVSFWHGPGADQGDLSPAKADLGTPSEVATSRSALAVGETGA